MTQRESILWSVIEGFEDGDGVIREVKSDDLVKELEAALADASAGPSKTPAGSIGLEG